MGGNGGAPFAFPGRADAIRRRQRLVKVGLRTGSRVDQIRLGYAGEDETPSRRSMAAAAEATGASCSCRRASRSAASRASAAAASTGCS